MFLSLTLNKFRLILFLPLLSLPVAAYSLQDYLFSVDVPELIIYPQTEAKQIKKRSRLSLLTDDISHSSFYEVNEYIRTVLTEMISVYEEEADRARERAVIIKDKEKKQKLFRWSNNVLNYADQLIEVYNGINEYSQLQVYTDNNFESYLLIDNYPVVVTSPVINEQRTLEERIINSVCERLFCDMEQLEKISDDTKKRIRVRAGWKIFEDRYVFYTQTGLHFVFSDIKNKKIKQKMCLKIAADLNLISETLNEVIKKGVFVDWSYLFLQDIPGNRLYELVINPFGDKIQLPIMSIQYLNDFPEVTVPWLKERVSKARKEFYFHHADEFLKEVFLN